MKKNRLLLTLFVLLSSCLLLYKGLQKHHIPPLQADTILVYNQSFELLQEIKQEDSKRILVKLQQVEPYLFLNPSEQDEPVSTSQYYRLILSNKDKGDTTTLFVYQEDGKTILMKPYHYNVSLQNSLEELFAH